MNAFIEILQNAGIFLGGLVVRLLFFLAVLAAILAPVLVVFESVRAAKALKRRREGM